MGLMFLCDFHILPPLHHFLPLYNTSRNALRLLSSRLYGMLQQGAFERNSRHIQENAMTFQNKPETTSFFSVRTDGCRNPRGSANNMPYRYSEGVTAVPGRAEVGKSSALDQFGHFTVEEPRDFFSKFSCGSRGSSFPWIYVAAELSRSRGFPLAAVGFIEADRGGREFTAVSRCLAPLSRITRAPRDDGLLSGGGRPVPRCPTTATTPHLPRPSTGKRKSSRDLALSLPAHTYRHR
ncbi:hypothetical protein Bbelb_337530 [Branchiostoma belcheri]|nr:hypothetical protein Bbelb_337530 [Branchiostoma belcheri]